MKMETATPQEEVTPQAVVEETKTEDEGLINPDDIVFEAGSDEDMPTPETENYDDPNEKRMLKPSLLFVKLFTECLGKLPYSSILKNSNNDSIKLIDLIKFVETKSEMTVAEMNTVIGFVANCPMEYVRPLMEIVEAGQRQSELWQLQ